MVIFRSIVIFMVLAAFLSMGAACSSKDQSTKLSNITKEEGQEAAEKAPEGKDDQSAAAGQEKLSAPSEGEVAKQAPAAPPAVPKTLALTGTVAKDGEKMVLNTDLGDYVIAGQDLSEMVGKVVNVTGTVVEVDGENTINILTVSQD